MSNISQTKESHEELFHKLLTEGRTLLDTGDYGERISKLIEDIKSYSSEKLSIDDLAWLNDTASKWEMAYASILNEPISIELPLPESIITPQKKKDSITEYEIESWLRRQAAFATYCRTMEKDIQFTEEFHLAKIYWTSEVLDGKINFTGQVADESYYRLEETWLNEVKSLRAYFLWRNRGCAFDQGDAQDYFQVCTHLRDMLVEHGIKAFPTEFAETEGYLRERYLTGGRIDKEKARYLVERKARRIWEMTGRTDELKNWVDAETYVMMFYENIIPAVMKDDMESILTVLKALQFGKDYDYSYHAINCFEAALATYFLNPKNVQELWDEGESLKTNPESAIESVVTVPAGLPVFRLPTDIKGRFESREDKLIFKGLMTESQKEHLKKVIRAEKISAVATQKLLDAVDKLYSKSRHINRETSL